MDTDDLSFHRKYRPHDFSRFIGNDKMKRSAMKAINSAVRPQVVLFQGPPGCGKTTAGRIFSNEYTCENRTDHACGECYYCQQMKEYILTGSTSNLMNVNEIDIADESSKKDLEVYLDMMTRPSFDGSWQIFLLDEFHMASESAQNRLLKIAEEPPEKVLIILCTTDPDRILETIRSRCQYTFSVTKPSRKELCSLLVYVCQEEGLKYDTRALSLICVRGEFTPRKALILLHQIARESSSVTYDIVCEILDLILDSTLFEFCELLLTPEIDVCRYVSFIGRLKATTALNAFIDALGDFIVRGIYVSKGVVVEALDKYEVEKYSELFKRFSVQQLLFLSGFLAELAGSKNIELKLLRLGYTGLVTSSKSDELQDELRSSVDINDEKLSASRSYAMHTEPKPADMDTLVTAGTRSVPLEEILNTFGGTVING